MRPPTETPPPRGNCFCFQGAHSCKSYEARHQEVNQNVKIAVVLVQITLPHQIRASPERRGQCG